LLESTTTEPCRVARIRLGTGSTWFAATMGFG
jgi:hypothetical protein